MPNWNHKQSDNDISDIKIIIDHLPDNGYLTSLAQNSTAAKETTLSSVSGKVDTVDGIVDTIKLKTDLIPTDPAETSDLNVPTQNSSANTTERDVIGNKTDDENGNSLYARMYTHGKHIHSSGLIYPVLATSILLQKDAGAWAAFPATKTEIIPANTIALPFDLHFALATTLSANGEYTIALYQGTAGAETLICYASAVRTAIGGTEGAIPIQTIILPANTRISAALSSSNAAQDTLRLKLYYHEY